MAYRKREKMHWAKKRKITQSILIALTVILGLGVIALTGKVLDTKYGWVDEARDRLGLTTETVEDTTEETTSVVE